MKSAETQHLAKQLYTQTWPMIFGVLSLMSFQLADSAFISQLGILPLAVQGFTMPLQMVVIGVQVGLGIATSAVISRVLGEKKSFKAKQLATLVLIIGAIIVAFICTLIWVARYPILNLLGASIDVPPLINAYWPTWLISTWLGAMLYFCYSIARANGNTMLPGLLMMWTSLLNIALDPLFIFYFDLGLVGAAVATIISFLIGLVIISRQFIKNAWCTFNLQSLSILTATKELNVIMIPAMMSQLLPPISSILATKIVAGFGISAVAGWAMASRVELFSIVVVLALTMSLPPMIGRLFGAQDCKSIQRLVNIAILFVIIWQTLLALLIFIFSVPLAALLSAEIDVNKVIYEYLLIVPISLSSLGVCMLMVSVCNALAMPMRALLISSLRLFICYLPILWVTSTLWQMSGVFIGALIGNILAGVMAYTLYQQAINRINRASSLSN